jgi:hypothetical protein
VNSEWMKVMLGEIARKRDELEQARLEEQRRNDEAQHTHERRAGEPQQAGELRRADGPRHTA